MTKNEKAYADDQYVMMWPYHIALTGVLVVFALLSLRVAARPHAFAFDVFCACHPFWFWYWSAASVRNQALEMAQRMTGLGFSYVDGVWTRERS